MVPISRDTELSASGLCVQGDTTCAPVGGISIGTISDSNRSFDLYSNTLDYFLESEASQQSSIFGNHVSVQTVAAAQSPFFASASSSFSLQFSLDGPEAFSLTGFIRNSAVAHSQLVELSGPGIDIVESQRGGIGRYNDSGVLAAGLYTLLVTSASSATTTSAFTRTTAEFNLTPVPLPDSFALVVGVLALVFIASGHVPAGPPKGPPA